MKARFSRTVPLVGSRSAPAPLAAMQAEKNGQAVGGTWTAQDGMVEARRHNRVCPKMPAWDRLYILLMACRRPGTHHPPPPPIEAVQWLRTAAMDKRARLRAQLEWAEQHGVLQAAMHFLKTLPDEEWTYIG